MNVSEPCVQNNKLILISEENNNYKDFRIFFKSIFIANSGSNVNKLCGAQAEVCLISSKNLQYTLFINKYIKVPGVSFLVFKLQFLKLFILTPHKNNDQNGILSFEERIPF